MKDRVWMFLSELGLTRLDEIRDAGATCNRKRTHDVR